MCSSRELIMNDRFCNTSKSAEIMRREGMMKSLKCASVGLESKGLLRGMED